MKLTSSLMADDWGLEAIIRGWGGGTAGNAVNSRGHALLESDECEGVSGQRRPLVVQQPKYEDSPAVTGNSSPVCCPSLAMLNGLSVGMEDHKEEMKRDPCQIRKSKRKIKVVQRGMGDEEGGLSLLDKWNWRKYGQKTIKGSPYPRSYYRCSSTGGGCEARKQVEQSKDEENTHIITYISHHNHPLPTKRHAQAGRKITKFTSNHPTTTKVDSGVSYNTAPPFSDIPLIMEDQALGDGASFEHDWISDFDPFFTSSVC